MHGKQKYEGSVQELSDLHGTSASALQPQFRRPKRDRTTTSCIEQTWTLEALCLSVATAALASISGILGYYNGRQAPEWPVVSLNAVISALSTLAKLSAVWAATRAISQSKWAWFSQRERQLFDFTRFDEASRGVPGALSLIWYFRGLNLAVFGALAILFGAIADPFAQNLVHYEFSTVSVTGSDQAAFLARASAYDVLDPQSPGLLSNWSKNVELPMKSNFFSAIYQPGNTKVTEPMYSCPSGNCTWPRFSTVGFCHKCADVSSMLSRSCETIDHATGPETSCNVSLSQQGWNIRYSGDYGDLLIAVPVMKLPSLTQTVLVLNQSETQSEGAIFHSIRAVVHTDPITGLTDRPPDNNTVYKATECVLQPCVRSISAAVTNGQYNETVVDTWANPVDWNADPYVLAPPWGADHGMTPGDTFSVSSRSIQALELSGLLQKLYGKVNTSWTTSHGISFSGDQIETMFYTNFSETACPTPDNPFGCMLHVTAESFTKSMRDAPMRINGTSSPQVLRGTMLVPETFLRVQWVWFIVPVSAIVFSFAAVCAAMATSRGGVPLWKENALPLIHIKAASSDETGQPPGREAMTGTGWEDQGAKQMMVRLVRDAGAGEPGLVITRSRGGKLVEQESTMTSDS